MRKTKIIATLGPAVASYEKIRELVAAGMDVARPNFSHGDYKTHRQLADWEQIVGYFSKLAVASAEVDLDTLGPSTQGRPLIVATITSAENMRKIESIRAAQRKLADPRSLSTDEERAIVASQPAVVLIQANIHSNEIASSQMVMELAHRLVTVDTLRRALDDVVVLLIPSAPTDGEQMIVEWYRRNSERGGRRAAAWLYTRTSGTTTTATVYGTQRETRLIPICSIGSGSLRLFYDVHQMGNEGCVCLSALLRSITPHVDPIIVRGIAHIGAEMSLALEEREVRSR